MAELADALDLGSSVNSCRFKSCYPHQTPYVKSPDFSGLFYFVFAIGFLLSDLFCILPVNLFTFLS